MGGGGGTVSCLTFSFCFRNEEEVGVAIRESGIPRDEIFVVTKVRYIFSSQDFTYLHS